LAYLLPVIVFMALDALLGRRGYSFPNDNIAGHFGLGLNIVTGSLDLQFHLPAYTVIEVSGLLAAINLHAPDLDAFFQEGRIFNLLTAIVAAAWMGPLARRAGLGVWAVGALSLTTISMPTVALYAPLIVCYFPCAMLIAPLAVGLFLLAGRDPVPRWVPASVFVALGFALANLFLVIPVVVGVAFGLLLVWARDGSEVLRARLGVVGTPGTWMRVAAFAVLLLALRSLVEPLRSASALNLSETVRWAVAAAIALGAVALPARWTGWWALLRGAVFPMLLGWLVFCNVFILDWGLSAGVAFLFKGSASPHLPFAEVWRRADVLRYLAAWHWHWLMAAAALAIVGLCLGLCVSPAWRNGRLAVVAVIAAGSLILSVLTAADVSFLTTSAGAVEFGQESRYMIMALLPISLIAVAAFAGSHGTKLCAMVILLAFSAWSLVDYVRVARTVFPEAENVERTIERVVAAQLVSSPGAKVWCVAQVLPRSCALAYGFYRYRLPDSLKKLPPPPIDGGRVSHVESAIDACNVPDACRVPGRDLFIDSGAPMLPGAEVVWSNPNVGLRAWRLAEPYSPAP
jgi:hypothetical protein